MIGLSIALAVVVLGCGGAPAEPAPQPIPTVDPPASTAPPPVALLPLGRRTGLEEHREDVELAPGIVHTLIRRGHPSDAPDTGPWSIHVLTIDPDRLEGGVRVALAGGRVQGRGTLTSIASEHDTIAGVNAGYFVMEEDDGTPGDPAGICVIDGELVSENVAGRTSLVLHRDGSARVAELRTALRVTEPGGATREIDGLNRAPGLVRNCGGTGGDAPVETPKHDVSCTDESELVLYRPIFGEATAPGPGREAVLDAAGRVTEVRARRGGAIPEGGAVLSATGEAATWLRANVSRGERLDVALEVTDARGAPLPEGASAVNGGPRLLRDGAVEIRAGEEGFDYDDHLEHFGHTPHPRTLAGVTAEGDFILVVADGRQPDHAVGLTFEESARVLRALGAVDGVNLDGGGSTAIVVGRTLANRPSDATGERAIGDAILFTRTGAGVADAGGVAEGSPDRMR